MGRNAKQKTGKIVEQVSKIAKNPEQSDISSLIYDPRRVAFGRAQTFSLRLGWLPKIYALLSKDLDKIPSDNEMMTELGIGKNMITSIKHWGKSAGVLSAKNTLTDFGREIFATDGFDPYLEDEATLWLLHWKINSRPHSFTAGYFLFNYYFNSDEFTGKSATDEIIKQIGRTGARCAANTVKRDVDTALNMYARHGSTDESLESPFPVLGLIRPGTSSDYYVCSSEYRETLPAEVVGYAAAELLAATGKKEIPLQENLHNGQCARLDFIFRLTGDALLQKISHFCSCFPSYSMREAAGQWQLFFTGEESPDMKELLAAIYNKKESAHAA